MQQNARSLTPNPLYRKSASLAIDVSFQLQFCLPILNERPVICQALISHENSLWPRATSLIKKETLLEPKINSAMVNYVISLVGAASSRDLANNGYRVTFFRGWKPLPREKEFCLVKKILPSAPSLEIHYSLFDTCPPLEDSAVLRFAVQPGR